MLIWTLVRNRLLGADFGFPGTTLNLRIVGNNRRYRAAANLAAIRNNVRFAGAPTACFRNTQPGIPYLMRTDPTVRAEILLLGTEVAFDSEAKETGPNDLTVPAAVLCSIGKYLPWVPSVR